MGNGDDPVLKYWEWLLTLPLPYQWPWDDFTKRTNERDQTHRKFPYVVTIDSNKESIDNMVDWCWEEFGPKSGECNRKECWENGTKVEYAQPRLLVGIPYETRYMQAKHIHNHLGDWALVWALKTTYEDGFCDFCFKHADQAVFFKFMFGFDN